jgi:hypothetical protein
MTAPKSRWLVFLGFRQVEGKITVQRECTLSISSLDSVHLSRTGLTPSQTLFVLFVVHSFPHEPALPRPRGLSKRHGIVSGSSRTKFCRCDLFAVLEGVQILPNLRAGAPVRVTGRWRSCGDAILQASPVLLAFTPVFGEAAR